jgi:hypothetical protein
MAKIKLNDVRLSFPNLWKAKEFKPGDGKFRYDATFLIEPDSENDKKIRAAIKKAAEDKFNKPEAAAKFVKSIEGNSNKFSYQDGDLKSYDGYEGMMYLACHSKVRPLVIDRRPKLPDGSPNILTEADGKPYAGCYVNATVEIYCITEGNPGVFASFTGVQFVRDGDAFGGGTAAKADDFDDLGDSSDDDLV